MLRDRLRSLRTSGVQTRGKAARQSAVHFQSFTRAIPASAYRGPAAAHQIALPVD
jgi:hypothetical protein